MLLARPPGAEDREVELLVGPLHGPDGRMGEGPGGHGRAGRGPRRLQETPAAHHVLVSHRIRLQVPGSRTHGGGIAGSLASHSFPRPAGLAAGRPPR